MVNPPNEQRYTRIPNELLDAFCRYFPGAANGQVMMAVMRKTYGWNKKGDKISISQLSEATGLTRRTVIYCTQNLEAQNLITVNRSPEGGRTAINFIELQEDYNLWKSGAKSPQYSQTLDRQRTKYHETKSTENTQILTPLNGQNEPILTPLNTQILTPLNEVNSVRNDSLIVQGIEKKCQFLTPTKETTITKDNTKDNMRDIPTGGSGDGFVLPDWIPRDPWDALMEIRKQKKAVNSPRALHSIVNELQRLRDKGDDPEEVLNLSIRNSWKDVYPIKKNGGTNGNQYGNQKPTGRVTGRTQGFTDAEYLESLKPSN